MYRLGELIRVWRAEKRLPLAKVAAEIGVSLNTLRRMELGEKQTGGGRQGEAVSSRPRAKGGGLMDGASLAKVLRWVLDEVKPERGGTE